MIYNCLHFPVKVPGASLFLFTLCMEFFTFNSESFLPCSCTFMCIFLKLVLIFLIILFQTTDSSDAARDVLIDGIKHLPNSKLLLEVYICN